MIPQNVASQQGVGVISADAANTYVQTCDTAADLRAFVGLPGMQVDLQGVSTPNDGQGGAFLWSAAATGDKPSCTFIIANSTIKIAFLADKPSLGLIVQPSNGRPYLSSLSRSS